MLSGRGPLHGQAPKVVLRSLQRFFEGRLAHDGELQDDPEARVRLATAALFVEMTRIDSQVTREEEEHLLASIESTLQVDSEDADEVLKLAKAEASEAIELFQFTRLVDKSFSAEGKVQVVEKLWEIAFADAHLAVEEEHLVRKIANLLHVPHRDFIAAKKRARQAGAG